MANIVRLTPVQTASAIVCVLSTDLAVILTDG